jgi:hypothetical protein
VFFHSPYFFHYNVYFRIFPQTQCLFNLFHCRR